MQSNSQSRHDRVDRKATPVNEEPAAQAEPEETAIKQESTILSGVVTDCLRLNVRKEAAPDAEVLTVIDALSKVMVDVNVSTDDFYKVCTATGIEGFCMKKYIALQR